MARSQGGRSLGRLSGIALRFAGMRRPSALSWSSWSRTSCAAMRATGSSASSAMRSRTRTNGSGSVILTRRSISGSDRSWSRLPALLYVSMTTNGRKRPRSFAGLFRPGLGPRASTDEKSRAPATFLQPNREPSSRSASPPSRLGALKGLPRSLRDSRSSDSLTQRSHSARCGVHMVYTGSSAVLLCSEGSSRAELGSRQAPCA